MSDQHQPPEQPERKTPPTKTFSAGRGLRLSVWAHNAEKEGRSFVRYSAALQKRFCDRDGVWHDTDNLFVDDLPRVGLLVEKAYEWIVLKESEENAGTPTETG